MKKDLLPGAGAMGRPDLVNLLETKVFYGGRRIGKPRAA